MLEQALSVFSEKLQKIGEKSRMDDMNDEISDLICDLQNAAVDSNQSFRRVAVGPTDHFFLPSSSEYQNSREFGSMQQERKDRLSHRSSPCMSANSVLGQALIDICVPKNVEGWDIKFSGSLNGEPFAFELRFRLRVEDFGLESKLEAPWNLEARWKLSPRDRVLQKKTK